LGPRVPVALLATGWLDAGFKNPVRGGHVYRTAFPQKTISPIPGEIPNPSGFRRELGPVRLSTPIFLPIVD